MRLLLDSHVLLWAYDDFRRLSSAARREMERPSNTIYVSAASVWELAIKLASGKLRVRNLTDVGEFEMRAIESGFIELPVTMRHAAAVADLGLLHADPFDRLLIAQARIEGLTVVTTDRRFADYPVQILDAD
jgi:PIN domain nuclease of toxin-antitoxin system